MTISFCRGGEKDILGTEEHRDSRSFAFSLQGGLREPHIPPDKSCRHHHNRMPSSLEPQDLKNTVKSTFSTIYDSFFILYDI